MGKVYRNNSALFRFPVEGDLLLERAYCKNNVSNILYLYCALEFYKAFLYILLNSNSKLKHRSLD